MNRGLDGLEPEARVRCESLLEWCHLAGVPCVVTSTLRTHAEQHALWLKGRPEEPGGTPGPQVTRADQYQSWHETGRAFDLAGFLTPSGRLTWDRPWERIAAQAALLGLQWGGTFKGLGDRDHFQYVPAGLTLAAAMAEQDARPAIT